MISIEDTGFAPEPGGTAIKLDVNDIVMGLHWTPSAGGPRTAAPANLDAWCVLSAADGSVLEMVHPGRLRSANGSVLHTGDSLTGASLWDDERIFVFLHALPESVAAVTFGVVSADGHVFADIPGASCHISDHTTDGPLLKVELTALGQLTHCYIATLARTSTGWTMQQGAPRGRISSALPSLADARYRDPEPSK